MKVWLGGFLEDPYGYDFVNPTVNFFAIEHRYTSNDGTFLGVV